MSRFAITLRLRDQLFSTALDVSLKLFPLFFIRCKWKREEEGGSRCSGVVLLPSHRGFESPDTLADTAPVLQFEYWG